MTQEMPIGLLQESKTNPRRTFAGMDELTASVKTHGILTPLLVRERGVRLANRLATEPEKVYEIIAGARRYRAAKACGLTFVPVTVREMTDAQALEIQIVENLQREDVHPLEEAQGYKALMESTKADVAAIAKRVGKSASYVYQRLKLADLAAPAQKAFADGKLSAGHAILIARLGPEAQAEAVAKSQQGSFSVRALAEHIQEEIQRPLQRAPWKLDDATLLPKAGACTTCPKRTGAEPGNNGKHDACLDPACWKAKGEAHIARLNAELKEKQKPPLLRVSAGYYSKAGILRSNAWTPAAKGCPAPAKAILVDSGWNQKQWTEGELALVCVSPKCPVHRRASSYARAGGGTQLTPAEKKRRAETKHAWLLDQKLHWLLAQKYRTKTPPVDELRVAALQLTQSVSNFRWQATLLAPAFGIDVRNENPCHAAHAAARKLETYLEEASLEDLFAFFAMWPLSPSYEGNLDSKALRVAARGMGIKLAAAEKLLAPAKAKKLHTDVKRKAPAKKRKH